MAAFIDGCRLAHTQVLVSGKPPLTVYDVEETIDMLQWMIDAPLNSAQREVIRSSIVDDWRKKNAETIANVGRVRGDVFDADLGVQLDHQYDGGDGQPARPAL